ARKTIEIASQYLGVKKKNIIVSSTGVIGRQLPMDKIEEGIKQCACKPRSIDGHGAAGAILTTDLVAKEIAVSISSSKFFGILTFVVINESMVAIFGSIMPEPFAMPPIIISLPPSTSILT
ncbi:unnamed protein product, partial [marine sediment metagenome]